MKQVVTEEFIDEQLMATPEFFPMVDTVARYIYASTVRSLPWKESEAGRQLGVLISVLRQNPYELESHIKVALNFFS